MLPRAHAKAQLNEGGQVGDIWRSHWRQLSSAGPQAVCWHIRIWDWMLSVYPPTEYLPSHGARLGDMSRKI